MDGDGGGRVTIDKKTAPYTAGRRVTLTDTSGPAVPVLVDGAVARAGGVKKKGKEFEMLALPLPPLKTRKGGSQKASKHAALPPSFHSTPLTAARPLAPHSRRSPKP